MHPQKCYLFVVIIALAQTTTYSTSSECTLQNQQKVFCIRFLDCESAKQDFLRENKYPQLCGFDGNEPKVCCLNSVENSIKAKNTGDLVRNVCIKWRHYDSEVANEREFNSNEFKHLALVGYEDSAGEKIWPCDGFLISEEFVITTATCVFSSLGPMKYIRLGNFHSTTNENGSHYQYFNISETFGHPNFTKRSFYNDIALLKLNKPAIFNEFVGPVCLNTEKNINFSSAYLVSAGRKLRHDAKDSSENSFRLSKTRVALFSREDCSMVYSAYLRGRDRRIDEKSHICAGSYNNTTYIDTGVSGDPLQIDQKVSKWTFSTVIGVTSFGRSGGHRSSDFRVPDVYTRVSSYIDWIENIVWANNI